MKYKIKGQIDHGEDVWFIACFPNGENLTPPTGATFTNMV